MNLNKNYQIKKRPEIPSLLLPNPTDKIEEVPLRTYRSLENKRTDQTQKSKEKSEIKARLRKQLDMIANITNQSWLHRPGQTLLHRRNASDLMDLIKNQKIDHPLASPSQFRTKRVISNLLNLKKEVELTQIVPSFYDEFTLDTPTPIMRQRSNSQKYTDQPMKVKLFKKMAAFNKRENSDKLPTERQMMPVKLSSFQQSNLLKRRGKADGVKKDDQTVSMEKRTAQSINEPELAPLDRQHHLRKQESMLCRGQILAKDDELTRRKRCIRKLSIIGIQMDESSKDPVFLYQI